MINNKIAKLTLSLSVISLMSACTDLQYGGYPTGSYPSGNYPSYPGYPPPQYPSYPSYPPPAYPNGGYQYPNNYPTYGYPNQGHHHGRHDDDDDRKPHNRPSGGSINPPPPPPPAQNVIRPHCPPGTNHVGDSCIITDDRLRRKGGDGRINPCPSGMRVSGDKCI